MEEYLLIFTHFIFTPLSTLHLIHSIQSWSSIIAYNHILLCTMPGRGGVSLYHNSLTNSFLLLIISTPRASSAHDHFAHSSASSPASSSIGFVPPQRMWILNPQTAIANQISRICSPSAYGKRNPISVVFVCYWPDPRWGSSDVLSTSSPSVPASLLVLFLSAGYLPRRLPFTFTSAECMLYEFSFPASLFLKVICYFKPRSQLQSFVRAVFTILFKQTSEK